MHKYGSKYNFPSKYGGNLSYILTMDAKWLMYITVMLFFLCYDITKHKQHEGRMVHEKTLAKT
jgi:hypothetical protein